MKSLLSALGLSLLICLCLLAFAAQASAFSLLGLEGNASLGEWQGSLEGGYEFEDQQTKTPGLSLNVVRNRYDERLNLRNEGFSLIDPRLSEGSTAVDLDFYQEQDKFAGRKGNIDGVLIGYDVSNTLLAEKAYTATIFSNRHEAEVSTDFAGRTHTLTSTVGVNANLREYSFLQEKLPYFSSYLSARQEESDQKTEQLGETFKLDETREVVNYRAEKGFQTGDLSLNYEYVSDRLRGTNHLAFSTQGANINYSLDFGPTLNRRWDSRINYFERSGAFNESYLWVDELLQIDHFKNLSTIYHYLLNSTNAKTQGTITSQTAIFQVQHQLYRNLASTLSLDGFYETLSLGRRYYYALETIHDYQRSIPFGGTFYLDADGRYQINDNSIRGGEISVIDEHHTAPVSFASGLGFLLNNPFVIISTIVMFDTRGGSRIPTALGVDYDIAQVGNLTQIVILPTSLVIQPGDPLEVSYVQQLAPSARYRSTTLTLTVGLSFSWLDASYQREEFRQSLLSGQGSQFLYDLTTDMARVAVHKSWESFEVRGDALYEIYKSSFVRFTMQNYGQHLLFKPGWNLALRGDTNESFTDLTSSHRRTSIQQFQLSLDRYGWTGDYWSVYARVRRLTDTLFPNETDIEAGLTGRWTYGKFEIVPIFAWINRKWGPLKINDPHLQLRVIRFL